MSEGGPTGESAPGGGPALTHLDADGRVRMVEVGAKPETARTATAACRVVMARRTLRLILGGGTPKGDVLTTARVAGIMAAKRTADLIPLCHPLPIGAVSVSLEADGVQEDGGPETDRAGGEGEAAIAIRATVTTTGRTGVEMEALTAASVAALTIYDMCKAVDRAMRVDALRVVEKSGGRSGAFRQD